MYKYAAKLMPPSVRQVYKDLLRYNDIRIDHERFTGFVLLFGIGVSIALAFDAALIFSLPFGAFMALFALAFALLQVFVYAWLVLAADGKAKFTESVLPDALQLMAMNLKAGMTTDRALLVSARPEFGPLEQELSKAGKQILSGKEIKYALLEIPERIKSQTLDRTIRLIVQGIESGGELSELLEQTAEDIQNTKLIHQEVQANVLMYAIFIFFAAGIGAPMLFGISTYLVEVLSRQMAQISTPDAMLTGINIARGRISVSPQFLTMFALAALTVTSVFGSLIIGAVNKGESKQGAKYIPVLLFVSVSVFFLVRSVVSGIMAGL